MARRRTARWCACGFQFPIAKAWPSRLRICQLFNDIDANGSAKGLASGPWTVACRLATRLIRKRKNFRPRLLLFIPQIERSLHSQPELRARSQEQARVRRVVHCGHLGSILPDQFGSVVVDVVEKSELSLQVCSVIRADARLASRRKEPRLGLEHVYPLSLNTVQLSV